MLVNARLCVKTRVSGFENAGSVSLTHRLCPRHYFKNLFIYFYLKSTYTHVYTDATLKLNTTIIKEAAISIWYIYRG